ncbi:hypothetical protein OAT84_02955 [Gammaproteobacteria bacterium]|nr:hypothetical protein [Gammaproteobacteria bacterium]
MFKGLRFIIRGVLCLSVLTYVQASDIIPNFGIMFSFVQLDKFNPATEHGEGVKFPIGTSAYVTLALFGGI